MKKPMINGKTKLELTWIGKENRPKLEPRILIEDPAKSYHAPHRVSDDDIFHNKLIFGDNLLALKALAKTGDRRLRFDSSSRSASAASTASIASIGTCTILKLGVGGRELPWRIITAFGRGGCGNR